MNRLNMIPEPSIGEYMECVSDLVDHQAVRSMGNYMQHGDTDCLRHCLNVSYNSYLVCKRLGLDYQSAARGGILHDFFLYDWHNAEKQCQGLHALEHPRIALQNAGKYFDLNKREKDIIRKHMWPITICLPQYAETIIVNVVDKYCAFMETVNAKTVQNTRLAKAFLKNL